MAYNNRGGGRRGGPAALPDEPPFTAFIGSLPKGIIQSDIEDIFKDCQVAEVRLIHDKIDNSFKGFGYVEFKTREGLQEALEFNGALIEGKKLKVDVAEQKQDHRRGGAGGGSRGGRDGGGGRGGDRRNNNYGGGGGGDQRGNYNRGAGTNDNFQRGPLARQNFNNGPPPNQHQPGGSQSSENYENFSNRNTRNFSQGSQGGAQGGGYAQPGRRRADSRSSQHSHDGGGGPPPRNSGNYGNRDSAFAEPAAPPQRRRLNLKARTKPVESEPKAPSRNSSIFGSGKARDALVPGATAGGAASTGGSGGAAGVSTQGAAPEHSRSHRASVSSSNGATPQAGVAGVTQGMQQLRTHE